MNENLSVRMEKLETKVDALGQDMTEVKQGVRQLTDALSGDAMRPGVIAHLTSRVDLNANAIADIRATQLRDAHEMRECIQRVHVALLQPEELKQIRTVVSWFMGWKLVLVSLIPLFAIAISLYNALKP